ncbi:hypothetical protein [Paenibacillus sp.]|uniref:hypothetical protein n=1 Tax=Paenibacillus sp. TaxID=58172 RepID=UPI003564EAEF
MAIEHTVTSNVYGDQYLSVNVAIAAKQNQKTQLELTKKIEVTYSEANQAFRAYLEEARNVENLRADLLGIVLIKPVNKKFIHRSWMR